MVWLASNAFSLINCAIFALVASAILAFRAKRFELCALVLGIKAISWLAMAYVLLPQISTSLDALVVKAFCGSYALLNIALAFAAKLRLCHDTPETNVPRA